MFQAWISQTSFIWISWFHHLIRSKCWTHICPKCAALFISLRVGKHLLGKQNNKIIFGWFYFGYTVSATLNSTVDSPGEQRYANVKLATVHLPVDFTIFFFPVYSPDLAPSDYHLFRLLQNHLNGKTFDSNEAFNN